VTLDAAQQAFQRGQPLVQQHVPNTAPLAHEATRLVREPAIYGVPRAREAKK
jgi:hypothetical protein